MRLVQEQVKTNHDSHAEAYIKSKVDVTESYLNVSLDELTPWYTHFKDTVLSLRGITEYETFDHPVATMIVISSLNTDPVNTVMQLCNPSVPPFALDKPYVDTNVLRYYVVLHDPNLTTIEHSTSFFEKLKHTFGLHCHLLTINSKPRNAAGENDIENTVEEDIRKIWETSLKESYCIESELMSFGTASAEPNISSLSSPSGGHTRSSSVSSNLSSLPTPVLHGSSIPTFPLNSPENGNVGVTEESQKVAIQYGCYMKSEDIDRLRTMTREFVVQSMIPFMERNIQQWNEQVASARRGLTGRLFGASRRLFGTSVRSSPQSVQTISASGPNVPYGLSSITVYPFAAPEAQMRKLADFAFMLRNYKFAYTIYDTVRRDYATEKAYKYHAGTQEMMGVCLLMMEQPLTSKTDVDRHFELAVQQYLSRCRSIFHATRATVIYYELLKDRQMWKDIPTALVRMTGEDSDLRSALFLEQAALCFLKASKPMVRKYGFHLVMAGQRYGKASQRLHAFRCYEMAISVLDSTSWTIAKNHVQFALGRQAFHLARLEDSVTYFSNVLKDSKQTAQQQVAHIREFLFIYKQYATQSGFDPLKENFPNLGLPVINDREVQITLSNAQSNTAHREEWNVMESELLEESITNGYISSSKRAMAVQQQDDERVVCAVEESATINIELYNPLQISISLSDLMLGCQYKNSSEPQKSDESIEETMPEGKQLDDSDLYEFEHFKLQKMKAIVLEPLEKKTVSLSIIPGYEGSILITGLHYTLNELVHTFKPFLKKGKRLNKTKEEQMSVVYAVDRSLDILVTSPMPLLDITFHHLPETLMSGEVVQTVLEINNKGNKGLTALRLKTSHPSFICVGSPEDMDKNIYSAEGSDATDIVRTDNCLFDSSVISIPLPENGGQGVVKPGETTLVPLWIRCDRIGKHTFKLLFSYQSDKDNAMIAHRTLRYSVQVQVITSLKINAFTRPSTTAINEYILGIEIENLQTVGQFNLVQLAASSPVWTISPLSVNLQDAEDIQSKTTIPARQTTFAYYKIRRLPIDIGLNSPEAWTSRALGTLVSGHSDAKEKEPVPQINLNLTRISFTGKDIPSESLPFNQFSLNSRMQWRQSYLETQFPSISKSKHSNLFTLFNSGDVDLTIYWNIPEINRRGHHYIIGVNLGIQQNPFQGNSSELVNQKSRAMFEATAKERLALINSLTRNRAIKDESPVKILVSAPDKRDHDFEKEGLMKVPISLSLMNCSWNRTSNYRLELLPWSKTDQKNTNNKAYLNVYPFHWNGSTVFTGSLGPNEKKEINVSALLQMPGVYDINRWKLTVHTDQKEDSEAFIHQPTLPQLVTVVTVKE
ncbi:ER-golgi trafficking TRAPP I complex 85 kDa subunit-domain-containing protein [Sporodiniella umbellata]|nr:ER-golgi trafficking TRAPP I complex 85 kDa subunit-domain-containing protein [Sporodiniella umbellata]